MYSTFFKQLKTLIRETVGASITPALSEEHLDALTTLLYAQVSLESYLLPWRGAETTYQARVSFGQTSTLDTPERFPTMVRPLLADVFTYLSSPQKGSTDSGSQSTLGAQHTFDAPAFHIALARSCADAWVANRASYFDGGSAEGMLGRTKWLYKWVRETLGVPMRKGIDIDLEETDAQVSRIYEGVVRGDVNAVLLKVFGDDE
jgi:phenylalanine ammonia-lyase